MGSNERWLAAVDHRAVIRTLWCLGIHIQRHAGRYSIRRSTESGRLVFTIAVAAAAFHETEAEQRAAKGWTTDTLLTKSGTAEQPFDGKRVRD